MNYVAGAAAVAGVASLWALVGTSKSDTGYQTEYLVHFPELERLVSEFRVLQSTDYPALVQTAESFAQHVCAFERADQFACNRLVSRLKDIGTRMCQTNPHDSNTPYLRHDVLPNLEQTAADLLHNAILG